MARLLAVHPVSSDGTEIADEDVIHMLFMVDTVLDMVIAIVEDRKLDVKAVASRIREQHGDTGSLEYHHSITPDGITMNIKLRKIRKQ